MDRVFIIPIHPCFRLRIDDKTNNSIGKRIIRIIIRNRSVVRSVLVHRRVVLRNRRISRRIVLLLWRIALWRIALHRIGRIALCGIALRRITLISLHRNSVRFLSVIVVSAVRLRPATAVTAASTAPVGVAATAPGRARSRS